MNEKRTTWEYELHLALLNPSQSTINYLSDLGFEDNSFDNQYKVERANFRGTLEFDTPPKDSLWNEIVAVLKKDKFVKGTFEQESINHKYIRSFEAKEGINFSKPTKLPKVNLINVSSGGYKKCDLHISVKKFTKNHRLIKAFDSIDLPYVERGIKRIYTFTSESQEGGRTLFDLISKVIEFLNVDAKMCLEYTDRHLRKPLTFPLLPLLKDKDLARWKKSIYSQFLKNKEVV